MSATSDLVDIEVACALADKQRIIVLRVPRGTTALEAVRSSKIADAFADVDIETAQMGVFSRVLGSRGMPSPREYVVESGDRIEIYRPLLADPKEVRRQRVARAKQQYS
ncbi:MAG: RnfH family protein [Porticoccaceae bacterium]